MLNWLGTNIWPVAQYAERSTSVGRVADTEFCCGQSVFASGRHLYTYLVPIFKF